MRAAPTLLLCALVLLAGAFAVAHASSISEDSEARLEAAEDEALDAENSPSAVVPQTVQVDTAVVGKTPQTVGMNLAHFPKGINVCDEQSAAPT